MKEQEILKHVLAGRRLQVAKYLSGKADPVMMRDKQNPGGPRRASGMIRETVVTDTEAVVITRWLKDGEKIEDIKFPIKPGTRVVVDITGMEMNQGIAVLHGVVEPLE